MFLEEFHAPRPPEKGYVYVMRNARGYCKIGHSVNPRKRRSQKSSQKNPVRLIVLIPTDDMIGLELALQRRFALKHVVHEWFRLNRMDLHMIVHKNPGAVFYDPQTFVWT